MSKFECDDCKLVFDSDEIEFCCVCNQFFCPSCMGKDLINQGVDTHICTDCCKVLIDSGVIGLGDFDLIAYRIKNLDIPRWQKQDVTMFFYIQDDGRHGAYFHGICGIEWSDSQLYRIAEEFIDVYWQGHEDHYNKQQMTGSGMEWEEYDD